MSRQLLLPALLLVGLAAGCQKPPPPLAPPKPPEVVVRRAIAQSVTDYEEFTGRTEAVETVEVRARVTGYLHDVHFKEGADVKEGDLLFEIDSGPLEAEANRLRAEVTRYDADLRQAEARLARLKADDVRMSKLPPGAVSPQEIDKVRGDLSEAEAARNSASAAIKVADAALKIAMLNLEYTRVKAPIRGRVGRKLIDKGNTVKADETALTYIADLDRIYVYFDVDERTYLGLARHLVERGRAEIEHIREMPVWMGLVDEDGFPRQGKINFVDNRVDPNTGSVWVRGVFDNPKRLLAPGLFVRVRIRVGDPHPAVLIPEAALSTDQGQKHVYVLNDKDEAVYRRVEVGAQHGPLREVKKGVAAGDLVIVRGLQRVRPGVKVEPKEDQGSGVRGQGSGKAGEK